jgi:hypothetical protein
MPQIENVTQITLRVPEGGRQNVKGVAGGRCTGLQTRKEPPVRKVAGRARTPHFFKIPFKLCILVGYLPE